MSAPVVKSDADLVRDLSAAMVEATRDAVADTLAGVPAIDALTTYERHAMAPVRALEERIVALRRGAWWVAAALSPRWTTLRTTEML